MTWQQDHLQYAFISLLFCVSWAASIISALVAQSLGAEKPENARRIFRQGLILSAGLGLCFMIPVLGGETLMLALGQSKEVAARARNFLFWSAFGLPASLVFLSMRFFTMGHGETRPQLNATFVGLGFNLCANPILAYGLFGLPAFGLGVSPSPHRLRISLCACI